MCVCVFWGGGCVCCVLCAALTHASTTHTTNNVQVYDGWREDEYVRRVPIILTGRVVVVLCVCFVCVWGFVEGRENT